MGIWGRFFGKKTIELTEEKKKAEEDIEAHFDRRLQALLFGLQRGMYPKDEARELLEELKEDFVRKDKSEFSSYKLEKLQKFINALKGNLDDLKRHYGSEVVDAILKIGGWLLNKAGAKE